MKAIIKDLLYGVLICTTIISACKKKDNAEPTSSSNCQMSKIIVNDTLANSLEYNSDNKLSKVIFYDKKGVIKSTLIYQYSSSEVTETQTSTTNSNTTTSVYTIGSNGYASKQIKTSNFGGNTSKDTTIYSYDGNGYLIKAETSNQISTYTIVDGNNVKEEVVSKPPSATTTTTYEYYSDKTSPNPFGFPILKGKSNKNLEKKIISTWGLVEYTYELNSNGYITKDTETQTDNGKAAITTVYTYEYTCK